MRVLCLCLLAFTLGAIETEKPAPIKPVGDGVGTSVPRFKSPSGLAFDKHRLFVADTGNDRVLVFRADLSFARTIGLDAVARPFGPGEPAPGLKQPQGLAISVNGNLVIADSGNHRVAVYSPEGNFVTAFGKEGSGSGELRSPSALCVDTVAHVIVADHGNHRLAFFSSKGEFIKNFGVKGGERDQFNEPSGLALTSHDGKRLLLVANGGNARVDVYEYRDETMTLKHVERPAIARSDVAGAVVVDFDPGSIRGFWLCGGVAADDNDTLFALSTNSGELKSFTLGQHAEPMVVFSGGVFGRLNHPRAVAVSPTGKVVVADTGNNRLLFLDRDLKSPERPRVTVLSESSAVVEWQTLKPASSTLLYAAVKGPQKYVPLGDEPARDYQRANDAEVKTQHRLVLDQLIAGTAYRFKVHYAGVTVLPDGARSMEFQFATRPPAKKMITLRIPIALIVYPNVANLEHLPPDGSRPGKVSAAYLNHLHEEVEKARLFYWVNSAMKLLLDVETFVVEKPITVGSGAIGGQMDWRRDLNALLAARGKSLSDYPAAMEITAERRWRVLRADEPDRILTGPPGQSLTKEPRGLWYFEGSGGGTYGADQHPGSSHFLGGSDIAWLVVHEFHHQLDPQFAESGYPEYPFNHFAREDAGGFQAHFGEHYDGNAWILRHWPCVLSKEHLGGDASTRGQCARLNGDAVFFSKFGEIVQLDDNDEDGLPDDFALVPLDEARFGSDPNKKDTDDDGLDDLAEAMSSTWVFEMLPAVSNARAKYLRPDPRNPDTDSDGIPDGKDPYPLYAAPTELKWSPIVEVNGIEPGYQKLATVEEESVVEPEPVHGEAFMRWGEGQLGMIFHFNRPVAQLHVQLDCNNDGYFVGKDNVDVYVTVDKSGKAALRDVTVNNAAEPKKWAFTDRTIIKKEDVKLLSRFMRDGWEVHLTIPRNEAVGLVSKPGQVIGLALDFLSEANTDRRISFFEPYTLFQLKLVDR